MAFEAAYATGLAMTIDDAVTFATEDRVPSRARSVQSETRTPLTKREMEIAGLISQGMTSREIATQLFISERTVETHVTNMLNKLGVNSRVELTEWVAIATGTRRVVSARGSSSDRAVDQSS